MGTIRERLSLLVWSSWRVSIYAAVSAILLLGTNGLHAQQTPPPGNGAAQESSSEMAVKDEVTAVTEGNGPNFESTYG